MLASSVLSLALFVLIHAPIISARRGGGSGGHTIHVSLNLDSVDAAIFSFYIIFAILTFLQMFQALGALGKRRPVEEFPRRVPFITLALFAVLLLITAYSLFAVLQSQINTTTLPSLNSRVAGAMASFTRTLSHVFLYAALLLLLDYRTGIQALQYGNLRSKRFLIAFRSVSAVLLLIMFVCVLARVIIGSTQSLSYHYGEEPPLATRAYDALYHLFLAFYVLTIVVICGVSVVLWTNRRPAQSQYDWLLFDTNVLARIVKIVCPILVIRAVYEIIVDIITANTSLSLEINFTAFILADILINGSMYFVVIHVVLGLGLLPKADEEKEKEKNAQMS